MLKRALVVATASLSLVVARPQCIAPWCNPGGVLQESEGATLLASYFSDIHDQNIQYKIYLPHDYANEPDRYYPLVLLLPGYGSTEVYTDYFVQFVARMANGTFPRSLLVVLNPIGNAFWHDASQSTGTGTQVQGYSTVVNELIPHLEAAYRVGTFKENRAIVGFSMGGYGAMNLALRSNLFSSATSLDGAIRVVGNESPQFKFSCYNDVPQTTAHNLFTVLPQFTSHAQQTYLHLLVSTNGNADQAQLHSQLTGIGAAHRFEDISGTPHAWADFFAARGDSIFHRITDHLVVPQMSIAVRSKVLLQCAYNPATDSLSRVLGTAALLPLTEPYTAMGYVHAGGGGGESSTAAVLHSGGPQAITDWVVLELRNKSAPATVMASRSALLRADGQIVGMDGAGAVAFSLPPDQYYVAVRHRNHLGIMTGAPVQLTSGSALLDMSQPTVPLFGAEPAAIINGRQCLWSGDVDHDGVLKYTGTGNDRDIILTTIGGTLPSNVQAGYLNADINLDGLVKYTGAANDRDPILVNVGGNLPTAVRHAQLP